MALTALTGPWPLIQFHNHLVTESAGLLGRVIIPSQGRYLYTGQHKHRLNVYTDIHALNGIQTYDPSIRASADSSCLRPRGNCDRQQEHITAVNNNNPSKGIINKGKKAKLSL
jgi:hypothetical protein